MILAHLIALRLIPGAGTGAAVSEPIGRRRRTRRYRTPTAYALEQEYPALVKAAPEQVKAVIGPYLLRGDITSGKTPAKSAVDWDALAADAERVVRLFDLYVEYIDEEETTMLLFGDY